MLLISLPAQFIPVCTLVGKNVRGSREEVPACSDHLLGSSSSFIAQPLEGPPPPPPMKETANEKCKDTVKPNFPSGKELFLDRAMGK